VLLDRRLAPEAAGVDGHGDLRGLRRRPGACATTPTGRHGHCATTWLDWQSRWACRSSTSPDCPVQPNNVTETLLALVLQLGGMAPTIDLDEQGRPRWLFDRTVHEGCDRAGSAEARRVRRDARRRDLCLVKLGCSGPVVTCNVPHARLDQRTEGCRTSGGSASRARAAGFPDRFMPFMEPDRLAGAARSRARFTYGPVPQVFRDRAMRVTYEVAAEWPPGAWRSCHTGYQRRWWTAAVRA
jgi:hydrogenase small subunit